MASPAPPSFPQDFNNTQLQEQIHGLLDNWISFGDKLKLQHGTLPPADDEFRNQVDHIVQAMNASFKEMLDQKQMLDDHAPSPPPPLLPACWWRIGRTQTTSCAMMTDVTKCQRHYMYLADHGAPAETLPPFPIASPPSLPPLAPLPLLSEGGDQRQRPGWQQEPPPSPPWVGAAYTPCIYWSFDGVGTCLPAAYQQCATLPPPPSLPPPSASPRPAKFWPWTPRPPSSPRPPQTPPTLPPPPVAPPPSPIAPPWMPGAAPVRAKPSLHALYGPDGGGMLYAIGIAGALLCCAYAMLWYAAALSIRCPPFPQDRRDPSGSARNAHIT